MTRDELIRFLSQIKTRGIDLWVEQGKLRFRSAPGVLTDALRAELTTHKEAIIAFLDRTPNDRGQSSIPKAPRSERLPLSFAQERLWFLQELLQHSAAYHMPIALVLDGPLDVFALRSALEQIVLRHEALRTTFVSGPEGPFVRIRPPSRFELPVVDLPPNDAPALSAWFRREACAPFSLAHGPLFWAKLARTAATRHALLLNMHHIVADGWSLGVLWRDLTQAYEAVRQGGTPDFTPLPVQYADFALWQRQTLTGARLQAELDFWRQALDGLTELALPFARPRPSAQTYRGGTRRLTIPEHDLARLRALAKAHGATLYMLLLAAFFALLGRHTDLDDIAVGTPHANRGLPELEPLVGFFVNTLVVRGDLSGDPSFLTLLHRTRERLLQAYEHAEVPFEHLVDALQVRRDPSRTPLFQILFTLQNAFSETLTWPHGNIEVVDLDTGTAKLDLSLLTSESKRGLECAWEFNADLFDQADIDALALRFHCLLRAIVDQPQTPLSRLPLQDDHERALVLLGFNPPSKDSAVLQESVPALFKSVACARPDHIALRQGTRHWTYAELDQRSDRMAQALCALGVNAEVPIGLFLDRSLDTVAVLLAVLKAGGVYVPLDPSYPHDRLCRMAKDANVTLVITAERDAPELGPRTIIMDVLADLAPGQPTPATVHPHQLAYILFTSGSTGAPKTVAVAHRSIIRLVRDNPYADLGPGEVMLQFAPLGFDASTFEIFGALCNGATLVIAPPGPLSLAELARIITSERVSTLWLTALLFQRMVDDELSALAGLRQLLAGGDVLSVPHLQRVRDTHPHLRLINGYGPTECTTFATTHAVSDEPLGHSVPIGKPIAHTTAYVLDRELNPVPMGVVGDLYLGGPGLARGYLNDPVLTAQRFIPSPFAEPGQTDTRLYHTGDRARFRNDGVLEFFGRRDAQVKIRGFRVEPQEIEAALLAQDQIAEAALVVAHDRGDKHLVAFIVLRPGQDLTLSALRVALKTTLPDYLLPGEVVVLDSLPVTQNGKVDRGLLRTRARTGKALPNSRQYSPPRDAIEQTLADIWQNVLHVQDISRDDDFFEQGGHSLLATQVVSHIRARLGREVPLAALFEAKTIATLADRVRAQTPSANAATLSPAPRPERLPLSFAQQRLWFLDRLEPGQVAYHMPFALALDGPLDVSALRRALVSLVSRHEILRTTFAWASGVPEQLIHAPPTDWPCDIIDLTHLAPDEREPHALSLCRAEAKRPFSLAEGPLLRTTLLRLDHDAHVLLVNLHHIIGDGWSISVLVRELAAFYRGLRDATPPSLPALPLQYADFAVWQRNAGQKAEQNRDLEYWRRTLADVPALALPTDRARPALQTTRGALMPLSLDARLCRRLSQPDREQTPFMLLATALAALMFRLTGQTDVALGTPVANRTRAELEPLIGCFVNTLVLRATFSPTTTFAALAQTLKAVCLDAFAHQTAPFEQVVEAAQVARDTSRTPLFSVMLALNNAPASTLALEGLTLRPLPLHTDTAAFDLTFAFDQRDDQLTGAIEYNSDLFDAATIEVMGRCFVCLLDALLDTPQRRIAEIALASAPLLAAPPPTDHVDVLTLVARQAALTPDAVAAVADDNELTYAELFHRSQCVAEFLRAHALGADDVVALYFDRTFASLASMLGVWLAGAAYLPLDLHCPSQRLELVLRGSGARLVLTDQASQQKIPPGPWQTVLVDQLAAPTTIAPTWPRLHPASLAYVIFTSGTTGQPKGVQVSHGALANLVAHTIGQWQLSPAHRVLQFVDLAFDAAVEEIWPTLASGACLVLRTATMLSSIETFCQRAQQAKVTVFDLPTAFWHELVRAIEHGRVALPKSVGLVVIGGEAARVERFNAWLAHTPSHVRLLNSYGPTETTITATVYEPPAPRTPLATPGVAIGGPIKGNSAYVLDSDFSPVPLGVAGELFIGGAGVARGYLSAPALTAERFLPDPFSPVRGARMYRTGDRVRLGQDGLAYLGRVDQQVKIRGFRIETGDIEAALEEHTDVREAAVCLHHDHALGACLIAHVVMRQNHLDEPSAHRLLSRHLGQRLPAYMVPTTFVLQSALPRTAGGKIDKRRLPPPAAQPAHERSDAPLATATERALASLWSELLGGRAVGPNDDFFALGGHSLLAAQLVSAVSERFGVVLPLLTLFTAPTLTAMAQALDRGGLAAPSANDIEWNKEILLAPELTPAEKSRGNETPSAIFLTGATGFVGAFLVAALCERTQARITCLVRAADDTAALARLEAQLRHYQLWRPELATRLVARAGSLELSRFGWSEREFVALGQSHDCVLHNGAAVNAVLPYRALKAANVGGTIEALRLACLGPNTRFHFVSTLSVLANAQGVVPETLLGSAAVPDGGYAQSKWVAERLVAEAHARGLDATVYRLGRISGHSQSGACNAQDLLTHAMKACVSLGAVPDLALAQGLLPVDTLAHAIATATLAPTTARAYHLVAERDTPWSTVADALAHGFPTLARLDADTWLARLATAALHAPELATLQQLVMPQKETQAAPAIATDHGRALLATAPALPRAAGLADLCQSVAFLRDTGALAL